LKDRHLYRFGNYVLDGERLILRGENGLVGLPPKALLMLSVLVEQRGEVVSKQQLMDWVWPKSYVEEGNLSQNIFLLRRELGRSPEGGDYIQTLSKRGYRISVPVELMEVTAVAAAEPKSNEESSAAGEIGPVPEGGPVLEKTSKRRRFVVATTLLLLLVSLGLGSMWRAVTALPRVSDFTQLTHDGAVKRGSLHAAAGPDAELFTDGARVYFTEGTNDSLSLAQVSASGGETAQISTPILGPQLLDVSRSRSELLVSGHFDSAMPASLWTVPIPAGAPREIAGIHAWDASWSPDGRWIAFTSDRKLSVAKADGTDQKTIATLPGSAWIPRWSPDGRRIRLTVYNTESGGDSLWQVNSDGSGLEPILQDWRPRESLPASVAEAGPPTAETSFFRVLERESPRYGPCLIGQRG
jgi:DNA-binding winged helix-turn-helix (wHTH) protein